MLDEESVRTHTLLRQLVDASRRLYDRNLLAAGDGNISHLLEGKGPDDTRIAITPSGMAKAFMRPEDMAFLSREGEVLHGKPSSERSMHLAVYRNCPLARCVVHAHPPTAVGWTIARPELLELPADVLPEVILTAGRIPIVPYARPGTVDLADAIAPFVNDHRLIILARHGALCWGESLEEAINGLERLEHVAITLKVAVELGGLTPLPEDELVALRAMRTRLGPRIL